MPEITLKGYLCERCRHTWVPKENIKPKVCPKCKSPYWDTPRKTSTEQARENMKLKRRRID